MRFLTLIGQIRLAISLMKEVLASVHDVSHFNPNDHVFITHSLDTFARCPFWIRIWIQQEITLTPNVCYACPTMTISHGKIYFILDSLCLMLTQQRYVKETSLPKPTLHVARTLDRIHGRLVTRFLAHMPSQYSKLVARLKVLIDTFCKELEATHPVDYVYGLLGLTGLDIIPDYSRAAPDVWLELATKYLDIFQAERHEPNGICPVRGFLELHGILHFVKLCGAGHRRDQNPPTWAPVLAPLQRRHRFPICKGSIEVYMGLLELQNCPDPRVADRSLWVTAARVQTVSRCDNKPLRMEPLNGFAKTIATQFESFLATHGPTYVSGQALLTVPSSTLFNQEDAGSGLEMLYLVLHIQNSVTFRLSEQMTRAGLKRLPYEAVERKGGFFNGHKFICTEDGYIGLAGADVQEGIVVCIMAHLNQPAILRLEGDHHLFVGCCFMVGLMDGKVVDMVRQGRAKIEAIEIK